MISVRSGKGLGDSLYLQGVARHLVGRGQQVEVCTLWPDVFLPLKGRLKVSPFRRENIDLHAHYVSRKKIAGTDQFTDCCISAGIHEKVDFRLDWSPVNFVLERRIRGSEKPVVVVQLPRKPMDRLDGYGDELLPDCRVIQRAIDMLKPRCTIVQIGKGKPEFELKGIDIDLANNTSVTDAIDVTYAASAVLGYCSFIAPLAESLRKPALLVWSRRGLRSRIEFIRQIVPKKIFNRTTSRAVIDDCTDAELRVACDALCEQIGHPVAV